MMKTSEADLETSLKTSVLTAEEQKQSNNISTLLGPKSRGQNVIESLDQGKVVGKYRIVRQLGKGGQGKVFLAEDLKLGRMVALKTVTAGALFTESALKRFRNEARAAANLKSPNIVQLFDVFEADAVPFLAMEYVEGDTLLNRCHKGELDRRRIVEVVAQCCEAMGQAHKHGLIHRDLKPQNIMLTKDGEPKVMDFGLAKSILADSTYSIATQEGQVVGSPAYMSPEQASGDHGNIGPQSDVFALGTVLYQCLSNKLPHAADTPVETIFRVIHEDPIPLTTIDPTISEDLNAICMKALEKDPGRRYQDAGEMSEDLGRWLRNEPVLARPAGVTYRVTKAIKRNGDVALVAGVAATFLAITISASLWLFAKQSGKQAADGIQTELKTIANTAALMFTPAEMDKIVSNSDNPEAATDAAQRLNDVRRRNPKIENAYLFRFAREGNRMIYIADADLQLHIRQTNALLRVGYEWAPQEGSQARSVSRAPIVEKIGVLAGEDNHWTGYAPILDTKGEAAGILAVEMGSEVIRAGMAPVVRTTIQVGGLAACLFLCFSGVAGFRVLRGKKKFF